MIESKDTITVRLSKVLAISIGYEKPDKYWGRNLIK
jgi:hypothetical protein